jgi:cytidyltransferase-like protein|tara:strand:- start:681 stop:1214 length:534 start_codon:yes stop_codon:yes gene_type:complete
MSTELHVKEKKELGYHYGDFMVKRDEIMISGGFDPIHIGHVRMIREASQKGRLIVVVNSDDWLQRKKGYVFMPFQERAELIQSIKGVHTVTSVNDDDGTVCEALKKLKPTYFANGGDRTSENTPEMQVCENLNIEMIWNVGGGKIQSSSELVNKKNTADEMKTRSEIQQLDLFDLKA